MSCPKLHILKSDWCFTAVLGWIKVNKVVPVDRSIVTCGYIKDSWRKYKFCLGDADSDGDGQVDAADEDDDNDGLLDVEDDDDDGDGVQDEDEDNDGDGLTNDGIVFNFVLHLPSAIRCNLFRWKLRFKLMVIEFRGWRRWRRWHPWWSWGRRWWWHRERRRSRRRRRWRSWCRWRALKVSILQVVTHIFCCLFIHSFIDFLLNNKTLKIQVSLKSILNCSLVNCKRWWMKEEISFARYP